MKPTLPNPNLKKTSRFDLDRMAVLKPLPNSASKFSDRFAIFRQGILTNDDVFHAGMTNIISKTRITELLQIFLCFWHIFNSHFLPVRLYQLYRIQVYVRNKVRKITVAIRMLRFELPLEKCTAPFVSSIKVTGISIGKFLHEFAYAPINTLFYYKVKVVWHKAICTNFHKYRIAVIVICQHFFQGSTLNLQVNRVGTITQVQKSKEAFVVISISEYSSLLSSAIVEMIKFSRGKYDASCHRISILDPMLYSRSNLEVCEYIQPPQNVNIHNPTP